MASVLCFAFGNEVCGSLAAQPGSEPAPPALEDEVLTAGLPGSPFISNKLPSNWAFLVAQMVKCLPATWETQVRSLGREDLLEKEMATLSSTLAWKISWTEEPGRLQSMRVTESDTTE